MKGYRKFLITIGGLAVFAFVMKTGTNVNPFNLGLGIGLLVAPTSIANVFEHLKGK